MRFHLNYTPARFPFDINHASQILLIGSCFSENIGKLLSDHKFHVFSNPNGILFNPFSICNSIAGVLDGNTTRQELILERDGLYYSYLHHSSVNAKSREELLSRIAAQNSMTLDFIKRVNYLVITLGSAFYYVHKDLGITVANCHKQPGPVFEKKRIKVPEIVERFSLLLQQLSLLNPALNVIFTVSPVKYLKDGVTENSLSKSTLVLGIHELVEKHSNCFYFPAYELVNDDLRDYRFYKEDLAHPNQLAIGYIWEKFSAACFNPATQDLNQAIHKLNMALDHRLTNENGSEVGKLADFIETQKEYIRRINPEIQF